VLRCGGAWRGGMAGSWVPHQPSRDVSTKFRTDANDTVSITFRIGANVGCHVSWHGMDTVADYAAQVFLFVGILNITGGEVRYKLRFVSHFRPCSALRFSHVLARPTGLRQDEDSGRRALMFLGKPRNARQGERRGNPLHLRFPQSDAAPCWYRDRIPRSTRPATARPRFSQSGA